MELQKTKRINTAMLIALLISLVFIAPVKLQIVKFAIMLLILIIQLIQANLRKGKISLSSFYIVITYVALNFYFLLKGTYSNTTWFIKLSVTSIFAPLAWAFIVVFNEDTKKINFHKLMRFCLNFISIYTLVYIALFKVGIINWTTSPILGTRLNFDAGYSSYFSQNMTSLFFLIPYVITKAMNNRQTNGKKKEMFKDLFAIFMSFIVVLLTGRRALLLLTLATPILVYFLKNLKNLDKLLAMFCILSFLAITFLIVLPFISDKIGLDQDKFASLSSLFDIGTARREQLKALLMGLYNNDFLGAGLGVNAEGCIRSEVPGAYELTYVAKLFAFGVFGFLVLCCIYFAIFAKAAKVIAYKNEFSDVLFPIIIGLGILMIASFSNPYMGNFDYCWLLFFPLAFINDKNVVKNFDRQLVVKNGNARRMYG